MVWAEEHQDIHDAIANERQIRGWSRAKKEALIRGDYDALVQLSRRGVRRASFETAARRPPQRL